MAVLLRWLGAFLLLSASFNPTPWTDVKWSIANGNDQLPLTLLLRLILHVLYLSHVLATLRCIGTFSVLLFTATVGSGLWVLDTWGLLSFQNPNHNTWFSLLKLSFILGTGLSWGSLCQESSGQTTFDEVDDQHPLAPSVLAQISNGGRGCETLGFAWVRGCTPRASARHPPRRVKPGASRL
ncbi:MAG: DUF6524 family protein [Alphaproteobacteria bacterium]